MKNKIESYDNGSIIVNKMGDDITVEYSGWADMENEYLQYDWNDNMHITLGLSPEQQRWQEINELSKTNLTVKHALDQLILIYNLSKEPIEETYVD